MNTITKIYGDEKVTLYLLSDEDGFWHWCKNCKSYPKDKDNIQDTVDRKPKDHLCPDCYDLDGKDDCEGKSKGMPPIGSIVGE